MGYLIQLYISGSFYIVLPVSLSGASIHSSPSKRREVTKYSWVGGGESERSPSPPRHTHGVGEKRTGFGMLWTSPTSFDEVCDPSTRICRENHQKLLKIQYTVKISLDSGGPDPAREGHWFQICLRLGPLGVFGEYFTVVRAVSNDKDFNVWIQSCILENWSDPSIQA